MSHWTRLTWDWRWGCQLLIRFPFPSWTVSQNHRSHEAVKQVWAFEKKRKSQGPKKAVLASFLFGSHCLSCSCLNLDYRTHFSQFPFLMFLDLCCRIVGNTESGESARKDLFLPGKVWGPVSDTTCAQRLSPLGPGLLSPRRWLLFSSRWPSFRAFKFWLVQGLFPFSVWRQSPQSPPPHTHTAPPETRPAWSLYAGAAQQRSRACESVWVQSKRKCGQKGAQKATVQPLQRERMEAGAGGGGGEEGTAMPAAPPRARTVTPCRRTSHYSTKVALPAQHSRGQVPSPRSNQRAPMLVRSPGWAWSFLKPESDCEAFPWHCNTQPVTPLVYLWGSPLWIIIINIHGASLLSRSVNVK